MRSHWLSVLAGFVVAMSSAHAQFTQELVLRPDPGTTGRYTGSTTFGVTLPAGIADTVLFTAPVDGALNIDLAFRPVVGTTVITGFFEQVELDGTTFMVLDSTGHVALGPLDIAAGPHRLGIIAAAPLPHNVPLPAGPIDAFDVSLTLAAVTPAIPEPRTWALMLSGLAAALFVARRGRDVARTRSAQNVPPPPPFPSRSRRPR
jgi:hypothetical protein